jgi:hypothetical protein
MIDRYGRLFATRGRDNAAVAQRYLQGLTQAGRGTFAGMADVVEGGCARFSISSATRRGAMSQWWRRSRRTPMHSSAGRTTVA